MVRVPGVFWIALLAFVMEWLPQLVEAPWVSRALLLLLALAKAVEVMTTQHDGVRVVGAEPEASCRKFVRWLID